VIWGGDTNKNWTRQEGFNDSLKDWIRPHQDIASTEQDDETFAFYRQWLKQRDWTDIKAHPFDCPDGLYLCKYPSFHHGRTGERTGKANFLFVDGHAKPFAWGTLRVENFFPAPTTRQLRLYND
jgi:prepilin-type processing-associated H-X9-DG protein